MIAQSQSSETTRRIDPRNGADSNRNEPEYNLGSSLPTGVGSEYRLNALLGWPPLSLNAAVDAVGQR